RGVAQHMGARTHYGQACASEGSLCDIAHASRGQWREGRTRLQKDSAAWRAGTPAFQVGHDPLADVVGERQTALAPRLGTAYQQMTTTPVNVIESQSRHLAGTEPQSYQQ